MQDMFCICIFWPIFGFSVILILQIFALCICYIFDAYFVGLRGARPSLPPGL